MFVTAVFLTVVQHRNSHAQPSAPFPNIPVGSDAVAIGKARAGHYSATRDPKSLTKIADIDPEKLKFFTGNVYILPSDAKSQPTITYFQSGRLRQYHSETGKVDYGKTISQYLSSFGGSDIRVAEATYAAFEVTLPKEAQKLDGFTGSITFFAKDMKPDQSLTVTLKDGKVVNART